jgi:hypothetical protein
MPKNMANRTEEERAISTMADPVSSIKLLNLLAANLDPFRPAKKLHDLRIMHSLSLPIGLLP